MSNLDKLKSLLNKNKDLIKLNMSKISDLNPDQILKLLTTLTSVIHLTEDTNIKGIHMKIEDLEHLSSSLLEYVVAHCTKENIDEIDNTLLESLTESYEVQILESEEFKQLLEDKKIEDVDSLSEEELKDLIETCVIKSQDEEIHEDEVDEQYITKGLLALSSGNRGSAISEFKNAIMVELAKNSDYKSIRADMDFYNEEEMTHYKVYPKEGWADLDSVDRVLMDNTKEYEGCPDLDDNGKDFEGKYFRIITSSGINTTKFEKLLNNECDGGPFKIK